MKSDYYSFDTKFAAAIAATSFAIHSVEDTYQKKLRDGNEMPVVISSSVKNRKDDPFIRPPGPSRASLSTQFSSNEAKDAVQREASTRRRMEGQSQKGASTGQRRLQGKANAWEKTAIAKIRERHENTNFTILAWENEKTMRAKLQVEREQRELELKRSLILQHYRNKLARIDHIAEGVREQMEEKRRNEEAAVKERAKTTRSTGRVPAVRCFCF